MSQGVDKLEADGERELAERQEFLGAMLNSTVRKAIPDVIRSYVAAVYKTEHVECEIEEDLCENGTDLVVAVAVTFDHREIPRERWVDVAQEISELVAGSKFRGEHILESCRVSIDCAGFSSARFLDEKHTSHREND